MHDIKLSLRSLVARWSARVGRLALGKGWRHSNLIFLVVMS